jgi:hypothetical protein
MNDDQDAHSSAERTRIGELLATHGADVARWPADRRPAPAQLEHLLARDAALAEAFAREHALDAVLQAADVAGADDLRTHRLQQRILASLPPQAAGLGHDHDHGAGRAHVVAADQGRTARPAFAAHDAPTAARRARAAFGPALAALVPLLLGFGAGMSGIDAGSTAGSPSGGPSASEQAALAGAETGYADEATMAPFLVAANIDAMALEWQP